MIRMSLLRPVTVTMMVALVVVLGVISYLGLGRDLLPDIAYPSLSVLTKYEGAAPQEVEEFITKKLESALATVKGKRRLSSVSREGVSLITIEFEWGEDMQIATLNVREKLDVARFQPGFPQDAERPNILRWDPSAKPIVSLAVTGDASILELKEGVEEIIKPRLEQLDGVAFAQISGDVERVIDVEVERAKLALYQIDLQTITSAIERASGTIAGGTIKKGRYRYSLRTLGEFDSVREINKVVVARNDGIAIRVEDVAIVHDTLKDREAMALVNTQEAIGLLVYKESGSNTIKATQRIKGLIHELESTNPDFRVTLASEEAQFIVQALNNVWISLLFGGFFAFLVLILFLGDLKSPIFVFISIPIAIITTLVFLHFFHISLNLMSLGGLALGIGMLVDNSIVVLENIYRYREKGIKPFEAAFRGAREVAAPVAAATLTTIAVFFPIVYLKGIAGALFGEQALAVTFSLLSSLVVSLTVLPLLTALSDILRDRDTLPARLPPMPRTDAEIYPRNIWFWKWWEFLLAGLAVALVAAYFKSSWLRAGGLVLALAVLPMVLFLAKFVLTFVLSWVFQLFTLAISISAKAIQWILNRSFLPAFNFLFSRFERGYHATLLWCLSRKWITLALAAVVLALSGLVATDLKKELMPKSATGQFVVDAKLPPGTALEVTVDSVRLLERFLLDDPAVELVFSQIGVSEANLAQLLKDSGTNTAQLSVKLKKGFISLDEVYRLSEKIRDFSRGISGMTVAFTESESALEDLLSSEGGSGLLVQIEGDQFDALYQASDMLLDALRNVQGIKDLTTSLTRDYPQMTVSLNRDEIERYGFTISGVGQYFSGGMRGALATQYKEFDRKIDVRVRFSEADREDFDRVMTTAVVSPDGSVVPLSELLDVVLIKGAKEIRRVDQKRVALVGANLAGKKISEVVGDVEEAIASLALPDGVSRPRIVGEQRGIQQSFGQLVWALLLSCLLVYMIMAGQFESLIHPFVVIFTVPMGVIGTVWILFTFGGSINIMSLIGLIMLGGIVVNDAIVKVDFINRARREGASVREAILEASRVRLRPILMTTATTVLALVPMAFSMIAFLMDQPWMAPILQLLDWVLVSIGLPSFGTMFSSQGSEIQQPLGLVVIGGLTVATLLTLILIPVLYELFAGTKHAAKTKQDPILETGEADG